MIQYSLCRHIKTNGLQCHAPALHKADLCFFHTRLHRRHAPFRTAAQATPQPDTHAAPQLQPGQTIELAPLEDRDAVQLALSVVINALAAGRLDPRRATAILYGLQLASNNAARLTLEPSAHDLLLVGHAPPTPEDVNLAEPGRVGREYSLDWKTTGTDADEDDPDIDELDATSGEAAAAK